jgi:hypothetical protein
MAQEWFYSEQGNQVGPISGAQLKAMADSGQIGRQTLVWKEGMSEWAPASRVNGLFASAEHAPAPAVATYRTAAPVPRYRPQEPEQQSSNTAISGMVLGILSIPCACVPLIGFPVAVVGIIFSSLALKSSGRSMAIAGLICSLIGIVLTVISAVIGVAYEFSQYE